MTPQGIQTRFARKIMAELAEHSETARHTASSVLHPARPAPLLHRKTDHA